MARSRTIKPSFFTDDELGDCSPLARLLFAGLWTQADKRGRLEDRPRQLKVQILPYDDCKVDELLVELVQHRFISRYVVGSNQFIQVVNFEKHQHCHVNEAESTIPAPESDGASMVPIRLDTVIGNRESVSCNPITPIREGSGAWDVLGFTAFYDDYPRHQKRVDAQRAWNALKPDEELKMVIHEAVLQVRHTDQWQREYGKYVPLPATYLRNRMWEDELTVFNRPPNPRPDDYVWDDQYNEWRMPDKVGWGG